MINKAILVGNVGSAPEIKMMASGTKMASFSLATSESWKDKEGTKQDRTEWHRVTIFSDVLVGIVEKYVTKGSKLYIEGAIRTRKYNDASGAEKYTTEIVLQGYAGILKMLDNKSDRSMMASDDANVTSHDKNNTPDAGEIDDDIPF